MNPKDALNESLDHYGLSTDIFDGIKGPYVDARRFVWWRMMRVHGLSLMACERLTGYDHTTILCALDRLAQTGVDMATARPLVVDRTSLMRLLNRTLAELGLSVDVLYGRARDPLAMDARGAVWWYMNRVRGVSQQRLAMTLLGRAHGAVRAPINRFERTNGPARWGFTAVSDSPAVNKSEPDRPLPEDGGREGMGLSRRTA